MSPEEGVLLAQYASERDAEAFRTLVERHQRMVYGACLRVLGNADDAEDAAQDAFLQLARHAGRLRAPIAAWLHRVAVRAALATARKERRHRVKAGHAMAANTKRTEPTWDDMKEYVDEAIAALPEDHRQAIVLHFLEGRRQEDAAREIGLSQSGLSRRIQSGVKALRTHLAKKGVVMSVAALTGMLSANAAEAAVPLTLTAALGKMALAGPTTLKGAILMKISAITLVTAAAVAAGVVALNSGAQPAKPLPPPPAPIAQPAPSTGVVAPRFDREVPEWTSEGMAKGAGNALITLAGLVEKLDGAVTEGDEIRVPGWTEDDSRKMIMAIHDIVGAGMFIGATSPLADSDSPPVEWLALLDSPDRATRIGAAVLSSGWFPKLYDVKRDIEPFLSRAELMMKDPDPDVRAAGVFTLTNLRKEASDRLEPIVVQAFSDPSPYVRFVAVIVSAESGSSVKDRYLSEYERLSEDSFAPVRFMAWFRRLSVEYDGSGQYLDPAWVKNMVEGESNPIVRALILGMASAQMLGRQPEAGADMAEFFVNNEDPWLRAVSKPFLPLVRREGMPDMNALGGLLISGKPSHEIVGFGTLFFTHGLRKMPALGGMNEDFLSALSAATESGSLWRQYAVAFARYYIPNGAADEGLRESLCSSNEVIRVGNLLSAMGAHEGKTSRKTLDQVTALAESPLFVEAGIAYAAMGRNLPQEELLDRFRKKVSDAPDALDTRLLLATVKDAVPRGAPLADRYAFQEKAAGILLESRNAWLQVNAFKECVLPYATDARNPVGGMLIKGMEPEAFQAVLGGRRRPGPGMGMSSVAFPIMERLTAILRSSDAKAHSEAFGLLPFFLENANRQGLYRAAGVAPFVSDLLDAVATAWAADKDGSIQGMCDALSGIFTEKSVSLLPWSETSLVLRSAIIEILGYATDEKHGAAVAEMLGNLYASDSRPMSFGGSQISSEQNRVSTVCPLVWNAMESARWRIMQNGAARDRIVLMLGIDRSNNSENNWQVKKGVPEEIGKMLVEGNVPEDLVPAVVADIGVLLDRLPSECAKAALDGVQREDIAWDLHQRMISNIIVGAFNARRDEEAAPGWVGKASRLGWEKAMDETLPVWKRKEWLRMHVETLPDAAARVRELILDVNQPLWLREAAAERLPAADSKTSVYRDLLAVLGQIGVEMKLALAKSAAQCRDAPDSEDFFIAVITDESISAGRRAAAFRYQHVPWSSEKLRSVLTKLQEDPAMKACASQMLEGMK